MEYNKKSVKDVDVNGKKILLRCDFNVPMAKDGSGVITDDKRIRAALPTIQYLLENNAAVIACSHMGKPKGEWKPELSMAPVAARLSELLGKEVILAKDIVGEDAKAKAAARVPSSARRASAMISRNSIPASSSGASAAGTAACTRISRRCPPVSRARRSSSASASGSCTSWSTSRTTTTAASAASAAAGVWRSARST